MTPQIRVKVTYTGRLRADVQADCFVAGLHGAFASYEPGYPIYGYVADDSVLAVLAQVPGVVSVERK